jgi:hypothetical protein
MNAMNINIFNQYYFAYLRKLKDRAREQKDNDANSRNLVRAIKNHYLNYDKESVEYINFYKEQNIKIDVENFSEYIVSEEVQSTLIYKDITQKTIQKVLNNKVLVLAEGVQ